MTGSQRAHSNGQWMRRVCGSGQRMRHACNSMQRQRRVCGSGWEWPAAQLKWETVMAAVSQRHNCNGQQRRQRCKGWQKAGKIVMNNGDGDGQLWVKAGVGGRIG